jgi:hypothetical protein
MDLNELYFRHQISVMRAKSASDDGARGAYLGHANELAHRIGNWQQRAGAGAAAMWGACRAATDVPAGVLS